jgi:hypothetical protein
VERNAGIVETIGIIAVILSLLFVAFEIRQNTNTAAAQAVFDLNESGRQTLFMQVSDPDLAKMVMLAVDDSESMTEEQRFRYGKWVFSLLNLYESAWNHHQRGVISDEDLDGWKANYCTNMGIELFRIEAMKIGAHSPEFRQDAAQWCN